MIFSLSGYLGGFLPSRFAHAGLNQWSSIGPEGGIIISITIDPTHPNTLYAGTNGGKLFKSVNGGGSRYASNQGLSGMNISSLAIDPLNSSILYAGTFGGGVFKTTVGGGKLDAYEHRPDQYPNSHQPRIQQTRLAFMPGLLAEAFLEFNRWIRFLP